MSPISYRPEKPNQHRAPRPKRPAWLYPVGTELTDKRGHVWRVVVGLTDGSNVWAFVG